MKRTNYFTFLLVLFFGIAICTPSLAQKKYEKSERKALKYIKDRAYSQARKESKRLKKQGFKAFPGGLPMEKQLEDTWIKQVEQDKDGNQLFLFADGNGVGKTQTAAEMQAMEAAKLQLAGQISNEVIQIIEGKIANEQIDRAMGQSMTKVVSGSKNYVIQSLPYVMPRFKVMRDVGEQDIEVAVKLFYSAEQAYTMAQKSIESNARRQLEDQADDLIEEIDNIFDQVMKSRN